MHVDILLLRSLHQGGRSTKAVTPPSRRSLGDMGSIFGGTATVALLVMHVDILLILALHQGGHSAERSLYQGGHSIKRVLSW